MSHRHLARRLGLLTSAAAVGVTASLAVVAPAHAQENTSCAAYVFPRKMVLRQDNGYTVSFEGGGGPNVSKVAFARDKEFRTTRGIVNGTITGRSLELSIQWQSGGRGRYSGGIRADGFASGKTEDQTRHGSPRANWSSTVPFACAPAPLPTPAPEKPKGPARQLGKQWPRAEVTGEAVDVYDRPNEDENNPAKKLGVLQVKTQVLLIKKCAPSTWCEVHGKTVPGGRGWVWGHLNFL